MKKTAIIIALMAFSGILRSQTVDTVTMSGPRSIYFHNEQWMFSEDTLIDEGLGMSAYQCLNLSRYFHFDRPTTVYGLVAMVAIHSNYQTHPHMYVDSTLDQVAENLQLYEYRGGEFLMAGNEELPIHFRDTLPTYYLQLPQLEYCPPYSPLPPYPVYERYFQTPVTVSDSVFVGITNNHYRLAPGGRYSSPGITVKGFLPGKFGDPSIKLPGQILAHRMVVGKDTIWDVDSEYSTARLFLYPILTPAPENTTDTIIIPGDTIINAGDTIIIPGDTVFPIFPGDTIVPGGDTLAIDRNDPVYRYTNVAPNPATETVRVTSSFGLSRIEAYDLKGHLISEFRTPNSEFSTTLDVSSWPRGTYLLRITTPAGPTTKKLLIQ